MAAKEKTFSNFDKFGLQVFADTLTDYLLVERQFVDGSFVLSLNSEFGSGKTTFFQMWSNKLVSSDTSPNIVYLNAWESDFQGDPLLAIVSALVDRLEPKEPNKNIESIKETAGKLCRFGLSVGNDLVQKFTGIDFIKAGQLAEPKGDGAEPKVGHACFQLYREKQALFVRLRSLLADLAGASNTPIFVFVDELDRCRPTYAVEFLETIKHFFDIAGIVFVLGVDKKQLASSARSLFGQQLDFDEYYRKFAHRNVTLPVKSVPMTKRFCRALVQEYFSKEAFTKKNRFPNVKQDQDRTDTVVALCTAFSLNARQVHELFRTATYVLSTTQQTGSHLLWGWDTGTLFMTALSLKNEELYHRMGRKAISLEEFTTHLKNLSLWTSDQHSGFWWAALLYLGAFGKEPIEKVECEFKRLGVWDPSDKDAVPFQDALSLFNEAYGRGGLSSGEVFCQIYEVLEGLKTLAEQ